MEYCSISNRYGAYESIVVEWCVDKGIDPTDENVAKYFKLHLERGMLAICSEVETWRDKKESQEANTAISTFLRYGLTDED